MQRENVLVQFIGRWVVATLAIYATAWLIPAIEITDFRVAIWAGLIFGLLNALVRPVLVLFTLPAHILTLGLSLFFINALMLYFTSALVPGAGFQIHGFGWLLLGSILISVISAFLHSLIGPGQSKLEVHIRR
ncbi:MAG TPA: phage holin family protein [Candidatus Fraserbacteria bacterium]|nr:phage holin family protein [Candidatus Fraserbacteria bacterium]